MDNCLNRQPNSSAFLIDRHLKYHDNRVQREDGCRAGRAKNHRTWVNFNELGELISVVSHLVWILKIVKMPLTSAF